MGVGWRRAHTRHACTAQRLRHFTNTYLERVAGHDLVVSAEADEGGAADLVEEELALVPPELPPERVVDGDLL